MARAAAVVFMIAWMVRFVVGLVFDVKAASDDGDQGVQSLGGSARDAIAAVWSLSPSADPAFIVASYSLAALVTALSIKIGIRVVAARGVLAVDKRVLAWGFFGIVLLVSASIIGIVPVPERWLPGAMAELRFTGIPIAIMVAELMLAHAAGLEMGAVQRMGTKKNTS